MIEESQIDYGLEEPLESKKLKSDTKIVYQDNRSSNLKSVNRKGSNGN